MPVKKKVKMEKEVISKIAVVDVSGKEKSTIDLDCSVFDGKINTSLMNQAVIAYLANRRMGLACTKTRGEVRGGGRKPWRQKGTGRARVGSSRSPLWRGGGVTFGPKPHSHSKDFSKRMKVMALKSALNAKLQSSEIIVLDDLIAMTHKTSDFFKIITKLKLDTKKSRFIVETMDDNLKRATGNIKIVAGIQNAKDATTYEILDCKRLVVTEKALRQLEERVKKWLKT